MFCVVLAVLHLLGGNLGAFEFVETDFSPVADSSKNNTDARPTGLKLVMIGDSLTRYQYLSLAYFLRHGHWDETSHLVSGVSFSRGWDHFYSETTSLLRPLEKCDCYRERYRDKSKVDQHVVENRYFFDETNANLLVYLQGFGNTLSGLHGRIAPEDAFREISSFHYNHTKTEWQWEYKDWGEAIEKYVARLNATHVLVNAGLWPNDFGDNEASRTSLAHAFNSTGITGIWKTTTYNKNHGLDHQTQTDQVMGELLSGSVLDVSWTREVHQQYYWDQVHFLEPIYRTMNEQLLELLGYEFPTGYQRQNLTSLRVAGYSKDDHPTPRLDCGCPRTCNTDVLARTMSGFPFSCGERIRYLMMRYHGSQSEACEAAVIGKACGIECDPGQCGE